ncbi:hypothetical protein [Cohnella sp.]|uniref:hypothetical protein n=1 Tax=Cohnella sp. TaxID=1883426 RepID=UPI0037045653
MYPKVDFPKKVTMKWLDKAFAPLKEYLISQYPGKEKRIMGYMSFKENENGQFLYENRITSGQIVFDQAGTLVYCGEFALQYEFAPLYENQIPVVTDYAHPNVDQWIHRAVGKRKVETFRKNFVFFTVLVGAPTAGSTGIWNLCFLPKLGRCWRRKRRGLEVDVNRSVIRPCRITRRFPLVHSWNKI